MKKLALLAFAIILFLNINGQVCSGDIYFHTQTELNNFIIQNPNCTTIDGNVYIQNTGDSDWVWNMNGLSNITEITGCFHFTNGCGLTSNTINFSGLSNLTTIGDTLYLNEPCSNGIVNLDGFENLVSVTNIEFIQLSALENMDGLDGITSANLLALKGDFSSMSAEFFPHLIQASNILFNDSFTCTELTGFNSLESSSIMFNYFPSTQLPVEDQFDIDAFHNLTTANYIGFDYFNSKSIHGFESLTTSNYIVLKIYSNESDGFPVFSSLTSVPTLIDFYGAAPQMLEFPVLNNVGTINITCYDLAEFSFPALETVTEAIHIYSEMPGEYLEYNYINFSSLISVVGEIEISGLGIDDLNMPLLESAGEWMLITFCPQLAVCSNPFICENISTQPEIFVFNSNAPGCNSDAEVEAMCLGLYIQGTVFADFDCNGIFDDGDLPISYPLILNENNEPIATITASGEYTIPATLSTDYTLYVQPIPGTFAADPIYLSTGFEAMTYTGNDFALCVDDAYHDVAISSFNLPLRPGFENEITFFIQNLSFHSEEVSFQTEISILENLTINTASLPYTIDLNTIDFGTLNIGPGETIQIHLYNTLDASTPIDTEFTIISTLTSTSSEADYANNEDSSNQIVIGSYDPNDVTVDRTAINYEEMNENGEWLQYQIRFQNTGSAPAQFINVVNEQDLGLDMSTLQMIGASHDYTISFDDREITWLFDNIQLPDSSSDPLGSQGYVLFRIKTNPGISLDEVIESTAAIYFDYNEPVITNTASTNFYICPETPSLMNAGNTLFASGIGTFNWTFNGNPLSETGNTITITESGVYGVSVTANDCTSGIAQNNFIYISVDENTMIDMIIYPNPCTDQVNILLTRKIDSLSIRDLSGKLIYQQNNINSTQLNLDFSSFGSGVYIAESTSTQSNHHLTIIKK